MPDYQQITVANVGDIAVVRFRAEKIIDEAQIQQFGEELVSLVKGEGRSALILNFEGVDFLSSAALGVAAEVDLIRQQ